MSDRDVILWNTLAQVREPTGEVRYGDRVEVLRIEGTSVQVRTSSGATGWMRDSRQMMDSRSLGQRAPSCSKSLRGSCPSRRAAKQKP